MPKIEINGVELRYATDGSGDPLVLIPGFASGAWIWNRQTGPLSRRFRVVTFDPRGVSLSRFGEGVDGSVSIELIAEDVSALLDALDISSAHILGASFGGFVAQEFAVKYPSKLSRLILACTSFGGKKHVPPREEVIRTFSSAGGVNSPERIRANIEPAFDRSFAERHPEVLDEVCQLRSENPVPESVFFQQLSSATAFDFESRASRILAETLILTGANDDVVPMENSINLDRLLQNSRLEIFEGAGHMFFIEEADEFNRTVIEFLQQ